MIKPAYWTYSKKRSGKDDEFILKGEGDLYENDNWYVNGDVIWIPVREFVLKKVSFENIADEVKSYLVENQDVEKNRLREIRVEKNAANKSLEKIFANLSQLVLDDSTKRKYQKNIKEIERKLSYLEELEISLKNKNILSKSDYQFIETFLIDIGSEWNNIPDQFQSRLFKLIINKIVIRTLKRHDFIVEIEWKTDQVDTIWIERPFHNMPRIVWTQEELDKLKGVYSNKSWKELVKYFPGKTRDAIRAQAMRMKLKRNFKEFIPWKKEEVDGLMDFVEGKISYRAFRLKFPHIRRDKIQGKIEKLNLESPDINKIHWKVVNTSTETVCSQELFDG